jgi:hypothetical protein
VKFLPNEIPLAFREPNAIQTTQYLSSTMQLTTQQTKAHAMQWVSGTNKFLSSSNVTPSPWESQVQ